MTALVQGNAFDTGSASYSLAMPSSVTAGNIIVVGVSAFNSSALAAPTKSGTAVLGSWTAFRASNLSALSCLANVWVAQVTTGGTLTVISNATGAGGIGIAAGEFNGSWGGTQIDGTLTSTGSGFSASPAAGSITPTAGDLVISFQFNDGGTPLTQTPGTNYLDGTDGTHHQLNTAQGQVDASMEWWVDSAGTATTAPWTLGGIQNWGIIAGALKPSGGAVFIASRPTIVKQAVNRANTY